MKENMKRCFKYLSTFICLIIMFNAMLYVACSFPSKWIKDHIIESADIIKEQGDNWYIGFNSAVDNAMDALIVNEMYSVDSDKPIKSYMLARKNYMKGTTKVVLPDGYGPIETYSENNYDEEGNPREDSFSEKKFGEETLYSNYKAVDELYNFVHDKVTISQSYSRYYHGYLVMFRPMFLLFNITQIRIITLIIMIILLIAITFYIYKKINLRFSILFFSMLIIFGYITLSVSLQQQPMFLILMLSLLVLLINIEKIDKEKFAYLLFVNGCIVNFVDYLTTPALSVALLLLIYYAYKIQQNKPKTNNSIFLEILFEIIKLGLIWSIGYGMTWFSKFILADIFCNTGSLSSGLSQMTFRMGGEIAGAEVLWKYANWPHIKRMFIMTNIIGILVLFVSDRVKFMIPSKKDIMNYTSLIIIACIPIVWMILLYNHTIYHYNLFTYRNWLIVLIVFYYLITIDKPKESKVEKKNE